MALRGVAVGTGYFSRFQFDAWQRMTDVDITAVCDRHPEQAKPVMEEFGIGTYYSDYRQMFDKERPDFVDVITPPDSHLEICQAAAQRGIHIICQKPLAPSMEEAERIVSICAAAGVRFMVHENFRFQPWHRELKRQLDKGTIGERVHSVSIRTRMGDGWGDDAYLARQPYFRDYPKLLIFETGVHFIDTFRYLCGEICGVFASLRRLNPVIKGEDCGIVVFEFASGAVGVWDGNRYNEPNYDNPRYTFGELLLEGPEGSLRLYPDGRLTLQVLGQPEAVIDYEHVDRAFAGDCCLATQAHFITGLNDDRAFETDGDSYLKTLRVQKAVYASATQGKAMSVD